MQYNRLDIYIYIIIKEIKTSSELYWVEGTPDVHIL